MLGWGLGSGCVLEWCVCLGVHVGSSWCLGCVCGIGGQAGCYWGYGCLTGVGSACVWGDFVGGRSVLYRIVPAPRLILCYLIGEQLSCIGDHVLLGPS